MSSLLLPSLKAAAASSEAAEAKTEAVEPSRWNYFHAAATTTTRPKKTVQEGNTLSKTSWLSGYLLPFLSFIFLLGAFTNDVCKEGERGLSILNFTL